MHLYENSIYEMGIYILMDIILHFLASENDYTVRKKLTLFLLADT